jgi:hypothetical protein
MSRANREELWRELQRATISLLWAYRAHAEAESDRDVMIAQETARRAHQDRGAALKELNRRYHSKNVLWIEGEFD